MESPTKTDGRRECGRRTRERLMAAALELLAQHGEDGVTLRDITDSAEANVAAVRYHFGCMNSLLEEALEHSLKRVLDVQEEGLSALGDEPTPEALAAAFARPMIAVVSAGGRELELMQIVARVNMDPSQDWGERLAASFDRVRHEVVEALRVNLPEVSDEELIFRTRCAAGMLNWLVLGSLRAELEYKPEAEIERLMIPVLVGAFLGGRPD